MNDYKPRNYQTESWLINSTFSWVYWGSSGEKGLHNSVLFRIHFLNMRYQKEFNGIVSSFINNEREINNTLMMNAGNCMLKLHSQWQPPVIINKSDFPLFCVTACD